MDITVNLTVQDGVPDTPITTTSETSATFDGVTFTFDRAMPVGYFEYPGEPFVVADQAFNITSISPASSDIHGDGVIGNGTMKNPAIPSSDEGNREQGFDGRLAALGPDPTDDAKETPYSSSLNIDPGNNGSIAIASGEKASIVKSVRASGATSEGAVFSNIDRYVVLTTLDTAPPVGTCRPGMAGTAKIIRGAQDVDFTSRGLTLPSSWGVTVQDIIDSISTNGAFLHSNPENLRAMRTEPSAPTGYSGEFVEEAARYVFAINTTAPTTQQRDDMIRQIITHANDIEAFQDVGYSLGAGAGQGGCVWLYAMAAAALTKNATLMNKVRGWNLQPDASSVWITSDLVGTPVAGKNGTSAQTYFAEQVGQVTVNPEYLGSSYHERYVDFAFFIVAWEVASILAFDQGPAGYSNGEAMILNGGSLDSSNEWAAPLAVASVSRTFDPQDWAPGSYVFGNDYFNAWDALVADSAVTPFTAQPSDPPRRDDYFAAAAGGITFNEPSGFDYATEGSRTYEVGYSLDRVHFLIETSVTDGQTISGLVRGQEHLVKLRHRTASGESFWNFYGNTSTPVEDDSSWVGLVTPSGSESNVAPSYSGGTNPVIHARLHPSYAVAQWEEVSGTLDAGQVQLAAGAGYPSACYPAPSISYQWKRNNADITGATSQTYNRQAADALTSITCDVTLSNSEGSTTVTTAAVTAPAIQNPPTGTLIDTNFDSPFQVDYETEYNQALVNAANCTPSLVAGYVNPESDTKNIAGCLLLNKAKGQTNPQTHFNLTKAQVEAGETYRIEAQVTSERDVALSGNIEIALRRQNGLTDYDTRASQSIPAYGLVNYDFNVSIPPGETDLDANIFLGMSGGVSSGSTDDPRFTYLKISKV